MRDLNWWEIGALSLKIPFYQWRTLIACLIPAAIAYAAVFVAADYNLPFLLNIYDGRAIENLPRNTARLIAELLFQWCWMTALWHNTMRHIVTFPAHSSFWIYLVLFAGLTAIASIVSIALAVGQSLIWHSLAPAGYYSAIPLYITLGIFGLFLGWIFLRMAIWPACIVAHRRFVSPVLVWRSTSNLAWDFFLLFLMIAFPFTLLGFLLLTFGPAFVPRGHLHLGSIIIYWVTQTASFYSMAAGCAAWLLAFAEIANRRDAKALVPAA